MSHPKMRFCDEQEQEEDDEEELERDRVAHWNALGALKDPAKDGEAEEKESDLAGKEMAADVPSPPCTRSRSAKTSSSQETVDPEGSEELSGDEANKGDELDCASFESEDNMRDPSEKSDDESYSPETPQTHSSLGSKGTPKACNDESGEAETPHTNKSQETQGDSSFICSDTHISPQTHKSDEEASWHSSDEDQ